MTQEAPDSVVFWKKNEARIVTHEEPLVVPEGQRIECSTVLQSPWRRNLFGAWEYIFETGKRYRANAFSDHTLDTKVVLFFWHYYRASATMSICSTQRTGTDAQALEATEYLEEHKRNLLEWTPSLMKQIVDYQNAQIFGFRLIEACALLTPIAAAFYALKTFNYI
jgi:hypothetical protein